MEYLNNSKICREFLNQYSDSIFPELFPKLMKVAIYALYKTFHKWHFSMQELDEFINFFNYKNRNFELESKINNCPCPPCEEYLAPKCKKIQELRMGYRPPEELLNLDNNDENFDCYGYGKYYPNDDVYINDKNNFYDENYYIPKNRSFRNIQLYHKRLDNPKFITQEKKIYPHWWWNIKDDIEQEDYSENDSEEDHHPKLALRYPKDIEERFKKKAKRYNRNKSFSERRTIKLQDYDEERIFPHQSQDLIPSEGDSRDAQKPLITYSPSGDGAYLPYGPYGRTASDGFGRSFPKFEGGQAQILRNPPSPLDATTSGSKFPGVGIVAGTGAGERIGDTLGVRGPDAKREGLGPNSEQDKSPTVGDTFKSATNPNADLARKLGTGALSTSSNYTGTDALKSQIMFKRSIKQSTLLSYDKDFQLNGVFKKVRGKAKSGLKYSLCGNQLKEDKKGIRRRKK
jgi:hypothetical protein